MEIKEKQYYQWNEYLLCREGEHLLIFDLEFPEEETWEIGKEIEDWLDVIGGEGFEDENSELREVSPLMVLTLTGASGPLG